MRKLLMLTGILALMLGFMTLGYYCGIRHAICDAEMYITEFSDPLEIYIELDGNVYEHIADIC